MSGSVIFQSTLPRGSDNTDDDGVFGYQISIHAPSRERLTVEFYNRENAYISIHAPSRERLDDVMFLDAKGNFNPRSLAGATQLRFQQIRLIFISIHAPSRERPVFSVSVLTA